MPRSPQAPTPVSLAPSLGLDDFLKVLWANGADGSRGVRNGRRSIPPASTGITTSSDHLPFPPRPGLYELASRVRQSGSMGLLARIMTRALRPVCEPGRSETRSATSWRAGSCSGPGCRAPVIIRQALPEDSRGHSPPDISVSVSTPRRRTAAEVDVWNASRRLADPRARRPRVPDRMNRLVPACTDDGESAPRRRGAHVIHCPTTT